MTKVGVNTYFARSIFDVGAASTTMNSYFIPPSLSQSDIDVMADLWNPATSSSLTGHEQSKKVTSTGVVPGAIVHNIYPASQQTSIIKNVQRYQPERLTWGE